MRIPENSSAPEEMLIHYKPVIQEKTPFPKKIKPRVFTCNFWCIYSYCGTQWNERSADMIPQDIYLWAQITGMFIIVCGFRHADSIHGRLQDLCVFELLQNWYFFDRGNVKIFQNAGRTLVFDVVGKTVSRNKKRVCRTNFLSACFSFGSIFETVREKLVQIVSQVWQSPITNEVNWHIIFT